MSREHAPWTVSLRIQVLVLTLLVLLSSSAAALLGLKWLVLQHSHAHMTGLIAREYHLIHALAETTTHDPLPELLANHQLRMRDQPPGEEMASIPFYRQLQSVLAKKLGVRAEDIRLYQQHLWLPADWLQPGAWLGFPFPDYLLLVRRWLILSLVFALAVSLFAAILYARHLQKPLAQVGPALENLARDQPPASIDMCGPHEIRLVLHSLKRNLELGWKLARDRELMLTGISHDLRRPLSRIRVAAEMVPDPTLRTSIVQDCESMDGILHSFLLLANLQQDALPADSLELCHWLQERVKSLSLHTQEIVLRQPPYRMPVMLSAVALDRILDNLLANARQHGAPPVEITLTRNGQWACIDIDDSGPGIPEEERDRLLQPFQQGRPERNQEGAGLGLAIADRFASRLGGQLQLLKSPLGGVKARILLPLNQ